VIINSLNPFFFFTGTNLFLAKILMNLKLVDIAHDPDNIKLVKTTDCYKDIQEVILAVEDWLCIEILTKIDWMLFLTEQYTGDNVLIFSSWYVLVLCYSIDY
jgi:hypothetical protein